MAWKRPQTHNRKPKIGIGYSESCNHSAAKSHSETTLFLPPVELEFFQPEKKQALDVNKCFNAKSLGLNIAIAADNFWRMTYRRFIPIYGISVVGLFSEMV
ncbi:MAG: hypothetical protein AAF609_15520 [Cyanobacteria bacterium P01_C01_bin.120]